MPLLGVQHSASAAHSSSSTIKQQNAERMGPLRGVDDFARLEVQAGRGSTASLSDITGSTAWQASCSSKSASQVTHSSTLAGGFQQAVSGLAAGRGPPIASAPATLLQTGTVAAAVAAACPSKGSDSSKSSGTGPGSHSSSKSTSTSYRSDHAGMQGLSAAARGRVTAAPLKSSSSSAVCAAPADGAAAGSSQTRSIGAAASRSGMLQFKARLSRLGAIYASSRAWKHSGMHEAEEGESVVPVRRVDDLAGRREVPAGYGIKDGSGRGQLSEADATGSTSSATSWQPSLSRKAAAGVTCSSKIERTDGRGGLQQTVPPLAASGRPYPIGSVLRTSLQPAAAAAAGVSSSNDNANSSNVRLGGSSKHPSSRSSKALFQPRNIPGVAAAAGAHGAPEAGFPMYGSSRAASAAVSARWASTAGSQPASSQGSAPLLYMQPPPSAAVSFSCSSSQHLPSSIAASAKPGVPFRWGDASAPVFSGWGFFAGAGRGDAGGNGGKGKGMALSGSKGGGSGSGGTAGDGTQNGNGGNQGRNGRGQQGGAPGGGGSDDSDDEDDGDEEEPNDNWRPQWDYSIREYTMLYCYLGQHISDNSIPMRQCIAAGCNHMLSYYIS